jgi:sporulation protein YlmC with PRC-barrel domain
MARTTMEPVTHVLSTSQILGDKVVNRTGEDLGKIEELMLDLEKGRVAYAVLSFGGFLGLGDKHFALPFEALKLDADKECFILDIEKEKLKNAPGFDKSNPPKVADRTWGAQIYQYYGYHPYWQ